MAAFTKLWLPLNNLFINLFIKRLESVGKASQPETRECAHWISRIFSKSVIPRSTVVSPERVKALKTGNIY